MHEAQIYESWDQFVGILVPFLFRCGSAALCGAVIGLERELRGKPAGFRTNILICLGSAIYMAVGVLLTRDAGEAGSDPARIAAQVVTGIGFLGAGCIIQDRGHVRGLTSAATIWVVAAIGIIAGAGFPALAFVSAVLVVIVLAVLRGVEKRMGTLGADDYRANDEP